jgi:hypothetical protein
MSAVDRAGARPFVVAHDEFDRAPHDASTGVEGLHCQQNPHLSLSAHFRVVSAQWGGKAYSELAFSAACEKGHQHEKKDFGQADHQHLPLKE